MQIIGCASYLLGCAPAKINPQVISAAPEINPQVNFDSIQSLGSDSAQTAFLNMLRERVYGHTSLGNIEYVVCLYGTVSHDTAHIAFFRSTMQTSSPVMVNYRQCGKPNAEFFGKLKYLGTAHTHNEGQFDCDWSPYDDRSFYSDPFAYIDVVVCSQGPIWRSKPVRT